MFFIQFKSDLYLILSLSLIENRCITFQLTLTKPNDMLPPSTIKS